LKVFHPSSFPQGKKTVQKKKEIILYDFQMAQIKNIFFTAYVACLVWEKMKEIHFSRALESVMAFQ